MIMIGYVEIHNFQALDKQFTTWCFQICVGSRMLLSCDIIHNVPEINVLLLY